MTEQIKKLREMTGAGVMECQKALTEAAGDMEKAAAIIRERGYAKAEKRKDRATGAGLIETYIHNGRVGVMLEVRSETDFVAKSDVFKELAHEIVMQIAAMGPENVEELLAQPYIKDDSQTVEGLVKQAMAKTGENINVARFCRYEI